MAYSPNVNYRRVARNKAIKYGLDPNIFARQIGVESVGYSPAVITGRQHSPAGAIGIAQFMPGTAAGLGVNPTHPVEALDAAARLMASYVRKYGSYRNALIAYNAGPGAVGRSQLPSETVGYVKEILQGRDPGRLGTPIRPQVTGGARPVVQASAPPSSTSLGGLNAPGVDPSVIASLLQSQPQQTVQATLPAPPAFSGSKYLSTGMALPVAQQPTADTSLRSQLQAIAGLVPQVDLSSGGGTTATAPSAAKPAKVGRTLVVGDSLGVGTLPTLKSLLGGNVTGNALVGRSSARGLRVLKNLLRTGKYQNVVFDLGTNDSSPGQLADSLHQALDLAPNTTFYVPTLNGPGAAQKNAVLHRIAAANANVKLVPWHTASQGLLGPDGIHSTPGGYQRRGDLLAQALGYQPPVKQPARAWTTAGPLVAPSAAWNPAGDRMRPWLAQALAWAHQNGWGGTVLSGYRTAAEQDAAARRYGLSHYGPGGPQASNHRTGNAVDVTDPQGLAAVLRRYPGRRPVWAGPTIGDPAHFSIDGH